jgi:hypothetical protein
MINCLCCGWFALALDFALGIAEESVCGETQTLGTKSPSRSERPDFDFACDFAFDFVCKFYEAGAGAFYVNLLKAFDYLF